MLTRGRNPFGENFHRQLSTIFMLLLGLCLLLHAHKGQASLWGELPQTGSIISMLLLGLCLLLHAHKGQASLWGQLPQTGTHNIHASPWAVSTTTCSQGAGIPLGTTSTDRLEQYSCSSLSCVYYYICSERPCRHPLGRT